MQVVDIPSISDASKDDFHVNKSEQTIASSMQNDKVGEETLTKRLNV